MKVNYIKNKCNATQLILVIIDIVPFAVLNLMRNDCQTSVIGDKTELF